MSKRDRETATHVAKKKRNGHVHRELFPVLFVSNRRDVKQLKKMLKKNPSDVHQVNREGETALHLAADNGHVDVAKVLIQNGANPNSVDVDNETPLHRAAQCGSFDVVSVLIENGADANVRGPRSMRST